MAEQVTWQPVQLKWPERATAWLNQLAPAKALVVEQQATTHKSLQTLEALIPYQESDISKQTRAAIAQANSALQEQFNSAPQCLVVTPFQPGVSSGHGYQRYLSAPNLIQHLVKKLEDGGDQGRPAGDQLQAIVIVFLTNTYPQLTAVLQRFNSLLPLPELEKAARRAGYLANLEKDRQILPTAGILPKWQPLPLDRLTIIKSIKDNLTAQTASLTGYINNSPVATLQQLLADKQTDQQGNDETLAQLKQTLNGSNQENQIIAAYLKGGNTADIRRQLTTINDSPAYDWVLCAGVLMVGTSDNLSLIKEMLSL